MSKLHLIGITLVAGALAAGCGQDETAVPQANAEAAPCETCTAEQPQAVEQEAPKKPDEVLVDVNGAQLVRTNLEADVEKIVAAQGDKIPSEQKAYYRRMFAQQLARGFLVEKVLTAKAKAEGYAVTEEDRKERAAEFLKFAERDPEGPKTLEEYFKKFPLGEERAREEFENGIMIDKMIKAEVKKSGESDYEAEAQKIIDGVVARNKESASGEKTALAKIKELKSQLDKVSAADLPAKFAELAKANSACPSSAKGGDLGVFTHGQMVKEFDEAAFKLDPNTVSEPIKTQFGYHLIMTTKKIPAIEASGDKPAEPEKVQASHILVKAAVAQPVPEKAKVVADLKKQAERKFVSGFIVSELRKAKITVADEYKSLLPPPEEPVAKPTEK